MTTVADIMNSIVDDMVINTFNLPDDRIEDLVNAIRNPIESIVGLNCIRNIFGLISPCHYFSIKSIYGNYDIFYFTDNNLLIRSASLYYRILSNNDDNNKMHPLFNNKRDIIITALEDTFQIMIN